MQEQSNGISHRRTLGAKIGSVVRARNYMNVLRVFRNSRQPIDFLARYVRGRGSHPHVVSIRTPIGWVEASTYTPDDILTINEIFFRGDYGRADQARIVVDFGSNIGISALYFLSRSPDTFVYCFEPVAINASRLRQNTAPYSNRLNLQEVAVAEKDGAVEFWQEPTGRYGGIGRGIGEQIEVTALDSNRVLKEIVERHGRIDLLKIDIEMLEDEITRRIPAELARRIDRIVVEIPFSSNPLPETHDMSWKHPITTLTRR